MKGIKRKPMHGQFYQDLERSSLDTERSLVWLCSSGLEGETKSLKILAQGVHFHQYALSSEDHHEATS